MFHPLRDPQLQFKSEKYKLNKNMFNRAVNVSRFRFRVKQSIKNN